MESGAICQRDHFHSARRASSTFTVWSFDGENGKKSQWSCTTNACCGGWSVEKAGGYSDKTEEFHQLRTLSITKFTSPSAITSHRQL